MSHATIKAITPGQGASNIQELQNAWGHGPAVWNNICEKYLDGRSWLSAEKDLWPLFRDERLPLHQRAVLGMTYDRVYILKQDYARAAADIRAYLSDFPVDEKRVNHWPAIAELFESNPDHPAIGFIGTSVCDDLWRGAWDDEAEEYGQPDWSKTWSLYEHLEAKEEPSA